MLYLAGDEGDDTFLINTFLVLKQNPDKPDEVTNLTTLFGGTGSNRYQYLQNAPVSINGGSGYDTIIIVGTPIDDTFIITNTYIAGAGRIVNYTNVESIEVDGGGGNDSIYVLSTDPALTVTVNGGSGDDTIYIGGTAPPLVYDPPPFTYTPPAYHITTPQLGHATITEQLRRVLLRRRRLPVGGARRPRQPEHRRARCCSTARSGSSRAGSSNATCTGLSVSATTGTRSTSATCSRT